MAGKNSFLKEYFKNKKMVGAVTPSTRFLGEKMLENIDFSTAKHIIELGPGTGVFTDIMIERMRKDAKLLVFELNDEFYHKLANRINDSRVQIIHDSASNITNYLSSDELKNQDAVVSSLPLMVFSDELRSNVVRTSHNVLKPSGHYIQFQYSLHSKKFLKSIFKTVSVKFTIRNFPPAFVYTCRKA